MSSNFRQYNPEIVWKKIQWIESINKSLHRKIHYTMNSLWVIQKDFQIVSSTTENLCYGLIPSFSPIYNNGQILIDTWLEKHWQTDEKLEIIFDYLRRFKWDLCDLKKYNNDITLISQFSGLMIRDIISWNTINNDYILWKLFRKQSWSKIKEYFQLETTLKNYNLKSVIDFLEIFLNKTLNRDFNFKEVKEKSFPFVSPGFEFSFTDWWDKIIKIVWWYVDEFLLNEFWEKSNYFIFWANINNFLDLNQPNKKIINWSWSWRNIEIPNDIWKIVSITSDIKRTDENKITLQSNKIEFLLKNRLRKFLWVHIEDNLKSNVIIDWNKLIFEWDWKSDFFENMPNYLNYYYWWEIIENNDNKLVIEFSNFDVENFWKVFVESDSYIEMNIQKKDIIDFLWFDVDLSIFINEFKRIWCDLEKNENGYLIKIPSYKKNIKSFKDVLWEIISFILNKYKSTDKYYIEILKIINQNWFFHKINFDVPNFFIANWFLELDIDIIWKINQNNFKSTLSGWIKLNNYDLQLNNSLLNGIIENILNKKQKLENKWFSTEKWPNWYNIIFYINCKKWENLLNKIYDYLFTISNIVWLKDVSLRINNKLGFLENWRSFWVTNMDWENIWYLWKLSENHKIKWDLYICEIIITN